MRKSHSLTSLLTSTGVPLDVVPTKTKSPDSVLSTHLTPEDIGANQSLLLFVRVVLRWMPIPNMTVIWESLTPAPFSLPMSGGGEFGRRRRPRDVAGHYHHVHPGSDHLLEPGRSLGILKRAFDPPSFSEGEHRSDGVSVPKRLRVGMSTFRPDVPYFTSMVEVSNSVSPPSPKMLAIVSSTYQRCCRKPPEEGPLGNKQHLAGNSIFNGLESLLLVLHVILSSHNGSKVNLS